MRYLLLLFVALLTMRTADAETWKFYVEPKFYTVAYHSTDAYKIPPSYKREHIERAIRAVNERVSELSGWRWEVTRDRRQADVEIVSRGPHQDKWMDGRSATFEDHRRPKRIMMNSGWVTAEMSQRSRGVYWPYWWAYYSSKSSIRNQLLYETGHTNVLRKKWKYGTYNFGKLMNASPPARELSRLREVFPQR